MPTQPAAYRILSNAVKAWGPNTLLDMAMQFEMKLFISQKHCQSLMDVWWRGGYPTPSGGPSRLTLREDVSIAWIFLYALCPFANPYLCASGGVHTETAAELKDVAGVAEAIMYTHRLAKVEILKAGGTVLDPLEVRKQGKTSRLQSIMKVANVDFSNMHPMHVCTCASSCVWHVHARS